MTETSHPALEICSAPSPDASIIWLHGLGADGYDFAPVVGELALPCAVRFVFPHAPARAITINGGYRMPAWYDIFSPDITARQDAAGIEDSRRTIERLIVREVQRGVSSSRVLLAGFSQGGAIALHTGVRYAERLAGIIALSTYLPLAETLDAEGSPANAAIPIFMAHGFRDDVIPIEAGQASRDRLDARGHPVAWHEYPMAHTVCTEELADIRAFILESLGAAH